MAAYRTQKGILKGIIAAGKRNGAIPWWMTRITVDNVPVYESVRKDFVGNDNVLRTVRPIFVSWKASIGRELLVKE